MLDFEQTTNIDDGKTCRRMWSSVVLAALDEFIRYPIERYDMYARIEMRENTRNAPVEYEERVKQRATTDGISDARRWLWSTDGKEVLELSGINYSQRVCAALLGFVIDGKTSKRITTEDDDE